MRIHHLFIVSIIFLTSLGCQTEVDKFVPYEFIAPGDFEDVLAPLQNLAAENIVIAENGGLIELNNSVLYVPPRAFIRQNNEQAEGEVIVSVVEINKKADLIKYDLTSTNNLGDLMEFRTTFFIEAYQNGVALDFDPDGDGLKVLIFDGQPTAYEVYEQQEEVEEATWQLSNVAMETGNITFEHGNYFIDTLGYQLAIKESKWYSLQRELSATAYTSLCLELLESNTPTNTRAFMVYDNANTCQRLMVSPTSDCAMTTVPVEFEGTIVVLAHKGGDQAEAVSKRIVISANEPVVELEPIRMTQDEILSFVEKL